MMNHTAVSPRASRQHIAHALSLTCIAALLCFGATKAHAQKVRGGVTISGEISPGIYGRVQIGDVPSPVLVYPQPVIIEQSSRYYPAPIYLHVPPDHAHHWRENCYRYNACNQHVYFVRSREYDRDYRPEYDRGWRGRDRDHERGRDHDRDRGHDRDRNHDRDHDRDHGHGNHREQ
jgi:hypothetical protein